MATSAKPKWLTGLVCVLVLVVVHDVAGLRKADSSAYPTKQQSTVAVNGLTRSFFVHLPPGYDDQTALPVVLVLHGASESTEGVEQLSGMSSKADKENFIAVYPSGTGRLPTWNAGNCCGYAQLNHIDDVAFLRALIDKIEQDYAVDPKRIFATGISNGAMMSYRLACELSDRIAAIAPVEGAQNLQCKPSDPVSVIIFHGTADHLVPFEGGVTPFQVGPKRTDTSVVDTVAFWLKENGCMATATHEETSAVHIDKYLHCSTGRSVELYAVQGGHHMWPGTHLSGNTVAATDLMWDFFAKHPKP
jgi:polyhydroxybutyrate depolymerase